jgi:hypothetical protein
VPGAERVPPRQPLRLNQIDQTGHGIEAARASAARGLGEIEVLDESFAMNSFVTNDAPSFVRERAPARMAFNSTAALEPTDAVTSRRYAARGRADGRCRNGSDWTAVQGVEGSFNWGSAPNDVWIVGNFGAIFHWDGTSSTQVAARCRSMDLGEAARATSG